MPRKNVSCSVLLTLMSWASLVVPASAQHFQQVTGTLVSVAAGRNEVFGIDAHGSPWRYNATKQSFAKVSGAKSLVQIAVGGGTLSQLDEVWAVASNGDVYRFNYKTKAFDQIPGQSFVQITVGEGTEDNCHPYEVWGVQASNATIYRYDYCANQFSDFDPNITQGATGGGDAWGLGNLGVICHFIIGGTVHEAECTGTSLTRIAVGVNDVWGINGSSQVFRYDPNTGTFDLVISGGGQVAAGGDGVWALDTSNNVYRWDPSSEWWVQIVGSSLNSIAVGSGAGVWGVNSSDQVFTFVRP